MIKVKDKNMWRLLDEVYYKKSNKSMYISTSHCNNLPQPGIMTDLVATM